MDALVFPVQPSGQGAPYIIDACDLPCAEEVFLHEPYGILYGTFTFRIMLIAYPQFQVLFSAEIIKDARPDDFAISFACYEYSILINDQLRGPAAKLAEAPVDSLTGLCGVVFVILCINTQKP